MVLSRLGREILLILTIKVIALYLLWFFCFSKPIANSIDAQVIANKLFTATQQQGPY